MKITLEKKGNHVEFYQNGLWFYDVQVSPKINPDIHHLRGKEWFTPRVEAELFDLISD